MDYNNPHECYRLAGEILREVLKRGVLMAREGTRLLQICNRIEEEIAKKGGKPAFPVNISVNEVAAHYTSPPEDKNVIERDSIVKVDVGVHVNGYIADAAATVALNPRYTDMVRVAKEALEAAIEKVKPGVRIGEISKVIEQVIRSGGYRPVANLTGHKIERYKLHAGVEIPNILLSPGPKIKKGEVYAIEPFVTDGVGYVKEGKNAYIFSFKRRVRVKDPVELKVLEVAEKEFKGLPFAERWLANITGLQHPILAKAIRRLVVKKGLHAYPVLVEISSGVVAQAEHTVLVTEWGCEVLTL